MMDTEEGEWVALTLQEFERSRCVSRVLKVEDESATVTGDHYASVMRRLKLQVMLHSGEVESRSFICKCMPSEESRRELIKESNVFAKEKRVYSEVLTAMDKIVQRHDPGSESFHARYIGSKGNDRILLEDLKVLGYRMVGHRRGLDFEHASILLQTLAKFHALGAVLIQEGDLNIEGFYQYYYERRKDISNKLFPNNFKEVSWILENKWKGEWLEYAKRLAKASETISEDFANLFMRDESRFNTILHGDCWFNNLLFRYNEDGKPTAVRLVDFQICFYNTPGLDLNYFLWTSLHTDTRPRKADLIRIYYESLSRCLRQYGYAKEPPSFEDILTDVKRTELFGFATSLSFLEFMLQPPKDTPDIAKICEDIDGESPDVSFVDRNKVEGEDFRRTMEYIVKESAELGLM